MSANKKKTAPLKPKGLSFLANLMPVKKVKMALPDMRKLVLEEMDHIPRRPQEAQSMLRAFYWMTRMNSLGKKADTPNDRSEVMKKCLASLAKNYPDVNPLYDKAFFGDRGKTA